MKLASTLLLIGLLCQSRETYCQRNIRPCISAGFGGVNCTDPLIKIIGTVSYQYHRNSTIIFNVTQFTGRLNAIFPNHVNATFSEIDNVKSFVISFSLHTTNPDNFTIVNVTKYQEDVKKKLMENATTAAAFSDSNSIEVLSAKADVDECSAIFLHSCPKNEVCVNRDVGFGCSCGTGFTEVNGTCDEIYCMLSDAPKWPRSATRSIRLVGGSNAMLTSNTKLPFKAYIIYTCPNRHTLVNSDSGTQVDVIECVGSTATTHGNKGWSGGEVRCDMTTGFMIAIVMAVISSAIILMAAGAFIVSCSKKMNNAKSDRVTLGEDAMEMEYSHG